MHVQQIITTPEDTHIICFVIVCYIFFIIGANLSEPHSSEKRLSVCLSVYVGLTIFKVNKLLTLNLMLIIVGHVDIFNTL